MCQECVDLMGRYYPHLNEADSVDLLWSATCFPFGGPEDIEPQLKKLRKRTDGSLNAAKAFADTSMRKASDYITRQQGNE